MANQKHNHLLSKSKLISAWQCAKKLHLEINRPELAHVSENTESLFATGNKVGELAKEIYGSSDAVEVPYGNNLQDALRITTEIIESGVKAPIYEATFQNDDVLVRVDVLLPDEDGWRAIEVKASTSVKEHHLVDCAIQLWVMRKVGLDIKSISLAYVDNQFEYQGDGDYSELLTEEDLTNEASALEDEIVALIAEARVAADGDEPVIQVGGHCGKPYDCQFQCYCWPTDAEYPVIGLGGGKTSLARWVEAGYRDIRDIDSASITGALQQRIHRVTCTEHPEVLDGAREMITDMAYPRYYLDFETIAPAVPIWKGTYPYKAVPVQWSCHIAESPESLRHDQFLDLSGEPPMRALAESMIRCLNDSGPILMYTTYETNRYQRFDCIISRFKQPP